MTVVDLRPRRALVQDLGSPTRWPALDGVRGLAVLAVVGWHVFGMLAPSGHIGPSNVPWMWWPMGTGRFGVDIFFVLSGFLVVRSWRATRARSGGFVAAARDFARRRALRILPAYWVSLAILVPLTAPALLTDVKRLFLLGSVNQYVLPDLPGAVNTVYWSLTTEWHFYLLVPLVVFLMARAGRWTVLAGCVALSAMWWSHVPPLGLPASFIFGRLDQFVAGAIAGELVVQAQSGHSTALIRALRTRVVALGAVVAVLALGIYHGSTFGHARGNLFDPFLHPLVALCVAAGLVALCSRPRTTVFDARGLRFAGLISYGLYLWHYPIFEHGLRWTGVEAPIGAMDALIVVLLLALSLGAAVLSYLVVERPFLHRKASAPRNREVIGAELASPELSSVA
ncbi:MAG TPA: acyltransferase [Acidimicrobiia bacterium]|jgi:peptidoglycan/LPS O-acetylase OafA/YrhL